MGFDVLLDVQVFDVGQKRVLFFQLSGANRLPIWKTFVILQRRTTTKDNNINY